MGHNARCSAARSADGDFSRAPAARSLKGQPSPCHHSHRSSTVSSIEYIRAGRLRALAVTAATRSSVLPDIPTVAEFVPGYDSSFWTGVGAPKNTPAEIVDKLNKEINAALADPKFKARLAELGVTAIPGSPADFGKLI